MGISANIPETRAENSACAGNPMVSTIQMTNLAIYASSSIWIYPQSMVW